VTRREAGDGRREAGGGRRENPGSSIDASRTSHLPPRASRLAPRASHLAPRASHLAPRVALVHDWLTGMRGGEKVLEAIAELYPDATIHTLLHVRGSVSDTIERLPGRRSFVQWLPASARNYRQYLPLFPTAIEQFDFDPYDLVISTSHCAAKSVVVPGRATHVCYCHSPMRYAWDQFDAYFGPDQVGPARSRLLRPIMARLARWDRDTADRVDRYVANSHYVAGRIRRYYNRGSTVVHPPVDTTYYRPEPSVRPEPFLLAVSALVPYKRLDVAIDAAAAVGLPLTIVGRGPEESRLRARAASSGGDITFTGWIPDEQIRDLYRRCRAAVMPGMEDFGMVPVEAQACGRPVVALGEGGALDSIVDGVTGILVRDRSVDAFAGALRDAATRDFDAMAIRRHAESFGRQRFQQEFQDVVADAIREYRGPHQDHREISVHRSSDPTDGSNAARYRQRRVNFAARENDK
jgi:glycosyltransferase involved in cell wall biosynthesis